MKKIFFSLLFIPAFECTSHNMQNHSLKDTIKTYLCNAITLQNSLKNFGFEFYLFTNNKTYLQYFSAYKNIFNIIEINFLPYNKHGNFPTDIGFYAAHHKIFLFKHISEFPFSDYMIFLDLDVIAINPPPKSLIKIIENRIPCAYNITDQCLPVYGEEKIINDLKTVSNTNNYGIWYGGEFLGGTPDFFKKIADISFLHLSNYIKNRQHLHHNGDEFLTNIALEEYSKENRIIDAGPLGIIGRFWSCPVKHIQRPLKYYKMNSFLLHLPADKEFLAKHNQISPIFKKFYTYYMILKSAENFIYKIYKIIKLIVKHSVNFLNIGDFK